MLVAAVGGCDVELSQKYATQIEITRDWRTSEDFYNAPVDVFRGVSLTSQGLFHSKGDDQATLSSFYCPTNSTYVCTGAQGKWELLPERLAVEGDTCAVQGEWELLPSGHVVERDDTRVEPHADGSLLPGFVVEIEHESHHVDDANMFCLSDEAPAPPPHVLSEGVESSTCMRFSSILPYEAANLMVSTLRSLRGVQITKQRPRKFCISAAAYVDGGLSCTFKIFVYAVSADGAGALAEFRRRRGDAVASNRVFRSLHDRLSLASSVNVTACEDASHFESAPASFQVHRIEGVDVAMVMLTPLLDMVRYARNDDQQAEAAGALQAVIGEDVDFAAKLCTPDFRASLARLLVTDAFCVAYPTARLIATFARCSSAAQLFTDGVVPLVRLIRTKVEEKTVGNVTANELSLALRALASRGIGT
jgi:hypothetical protein